MHTTVGSRDRTRVVDAFTNLLLVVIHNILYERAERIKSRFE